MRNERFNFPIGSFQCKALSDSTYRGPRDFEKMYPSVKAEELQAAFAKYQMDPSNETFSYNCLFIDTGRNKILVDTGIGKEQGGRLLSHLEAEGISPSSIDHVILTHGHGDHIGGLTDADGKLIYSNAQFWIWKDEWELLTREENLASLPPQAANLVRKNLPAIASRVNLLDSEGEFLQGVRAIHLPGHSIGMMAVLFASGDQKLIAVADSFHRPFQIENPSWNVHFDRIPE